MKDIRCPKCTHMLLKADEDVKGIMEIKCSSCKALIRITHTEVVVVDSNPKRLVSE